MKKLLFVFAILFSVTAVFAQTAPLEFKETRFSFGKVKQHVPVTHVFSFKNISGKPVIIETATAECGCTTPEFPKGMIAKNAVNTIKVTYNSEAIGSFNKKVTVKLANVSQPIILNIEGEVVPAAAKSKRK